MQISFSSISLFNYENIYLCILSLSFVFVMHVFFQKKVVI